MKNFIERLEELKCYKPFTDHQKGFTDGIFNAIRIYNELHPSTENVQPEPNKPLTGASFKVRITKSDSDKWYEIGEEWIVEDSEYESFITVFVINEQGGGSRILKSDCEIIPETPLTILEKFNAGWDITHFENGSKAVQVIEKKVHHPEGKFIIEWDNGNFCAVIDEEDGVYFHSKPKAKRVTTYHWLDEYGNLRGAEVKKAWFTVIGETITEQQPDGSFKIISTSLK